MDDRGDGQRFREVVAGRDMPCARCGYSLRDLKEPRCPECGAEVNVRHLAERTVRVEDVFLAGLVAPIVVILLAGLTIFAGLRRSDGLDRLLPGIHAAAWCLIDLAWWAYMRHRPGMSGASLLRWLPLAGGMPLILLLTLLYWS